VLGTRHEGCNPSQVLGREGLAIRAKRTDAIWRDGVMA